MKLLTTKQLVRIGRVRCFDLDDDFEAEGAQDSIYSVKQKINDEYLASQKWIQDREFSQKNIIDPIRKGICLEDVIAADVSFFTNLRGLFAHYAYDIDISGWTFADNADCSYMFAFSEFDQWEHLPKELRDELINPQRKIDTTGIFYGCKREIEFYQEIEKERKKRNLALPN